jgi:hypothetical protein
MANKDQEIFSLKQKNSSLETELTTIKKILELMPGNLYWKDRSGKYLGSNKNNADNCVASLVKHFGHRVPEMYSTCATR